MIAELFKNKNEETELHIDDYFVSTHSNFDFNDQQKIKIQMVIDRAMEYAYQKGQNDKVDEINNTLKKGVLPNAQDND